MQVLVRHVPFLAVVVPSLPRNASVELEVRAWPRVRRYVHFYLSIYHMRRKRTSCRSGGLFLTKHVLILCGFLPLSGRCRVLRLG